MTGPASGLLVRDVALDDAAAIVDILNPIVEARVHTAFVEPFDVAAERQFISTFPARGIWKVAVRRADERVVGFQVVEPFGPYTRAFDHVATIGTYVDLTLRRQGIGAALFEATFAAARGKGYQKLFAFVRADNPDGLAAYRSRGFEIIGTARRHARIDGRYVDEILIERALRDFETRRAGPADAEAIADAHRDSIRSIGPRFYPPDVIEAWESCVTPDMYAQAMAEGEAFFIAVGPVDGAPGVLGFATHRADDARDGASVYVRGRAARQGVGTALLRLAEQHAIAHGASSLHIQASLAGLPFYRANGFDELGSGEAVLVSGQSMPCVHMRKRLPGG